MKKQILAFMLTSVLLVGCGATPDLPSNQNEPMTSEDTAADKTEIQITTLKAGTGEEEAKAGSFLLVHYTGTLENGEKFDSSVDRGQPFNFTLGTGQVIAGWDEGMLGMKVGEKRKLVIPAEYAYGEAGFPPVIPANATLTFEVELLEIVKPTWSK